MYAIGKNKVTCGEPGSSYVDQFTGETVRIAGCCQPGTEVVDHNGVELEYCEIHALKIWKEQDAQLDVTSE